jgi:hypothetical protein
LRTRTPFDTIESDGTYTGTDAAALKAFGEKEWRKPEGISFDSSAAIQQIVTGRADISTRAWHRTELAGTLLARTFATAASGGAIKVPLRTRQ